MRSFRICMVSLFCVLSLYLFNHIPVGASVPADSREARDVVMTGPSADCVDADEDGWCEGDDCNDNDPAIHPGAIEIPGNAIDENCDGSDAGICYVDSDGDGYGDPWNVFLSSDGDCDDPGEAWSGDDCDDTAGSIHPGAVDTPDDGIDQDCDGQDATTTAVEPSSWSRIKALLRG
ncbi:MAG TPA: putative metal-binding motif-containing protein [Candidatus Krumholzibacterium sp.]|nr:putative metal-binding motif-containing protein [Candidatus Krumholzibacterium sp.]